MTCCSSGGCATPATCCGCKEDPPTKDACMCGCGYLNGPAPILWAKSFTLAGACLSVAALGDCAFAELDSDLDIIPDFDITAKRIGFVTFEGIDGQCYWYDQYTDLVPPEGQLYFYWTMLESAWQQLAMVGCVAAVFSWYFFWYTTSYCCSSQVRPVRYTSGFVMAVLLTVVQGCTFIAYNTGPCARGGNSCSLGRSGWFSIGAILSFFFAGCTFCMMSDYPGDRWQPPTSRDQHEDADEIPAKDIAGDDHDMVMEPEHIEAQTY